MAILIRANTPAETIAEVRKYIHRLAVSHRNQADMEHSVTKQRLLLARSMELENVYANLADVVIIERKESEQ